MINKFIIFKKSLFVIAFCISYNSKSQISPLNSPPVNFSGVYSSGTQNNAAYNAVLNTVNVSNAAYYSIKARNSVSVLPGNAAANLSSGSFAAYIETSPIEVVSYHPSGFNSIPLYDKFELGIKLPMETNPALNLAKKIDDFFGNTNYVAANSTSYSCPNGYGNQFNTGTNYINPYDPDQISVEATFSFPGKPSQTIYGFYYREYTYQYNSGSTMTYTNANWVENTNLQYHWRVRFAPRYIGTYTVTWKIKTNNGTTLSYEDNIGQTFSTITSNSKGFVKIGAGKKFMVTQPDEAQQEKAILPIGMCYTWPPDGISKDAPEGGLDDVPPSDAGQWGCIFQNNYAYPSRFHKHRETIRERLANQGANYVRVFMPYHGYDIEWEKAGVYDADPVKPLGSGIPNNANPQFANYKGVNRQALLWELDSLVDMAKIKNLYIQLVTEENSNGFSAKHAPNDPNTWVTQNPYSDLISNLDPNSVAQFFNDPIAINMYKKKLRYLIARYGYATSIASFEMLNEFHFLDEQIGLPNAIDNIFKPWLDTMLNYIKKPYGLNHKDHLCTASYQLGFGGDNVGSLTNLDFFSTHPYVDDWDNFDNCNTNCNGKNSFYRAYKDLSDYKGLYNKPCQASELGIHSSGKCMNGNYYPSYVNQFPEYMAVTFHALLWSTTFVGGLTSGLEMWNRGLDIVPSSQTPSGCDRGYIQHFKPIQSFIANVNFDQEDYVPRYFRNNNNTGPLESFYLINHNSMNADHALGYVRNRTFWWSYFTNPNSPSYAYMPHLTYQYQNLYTTSPSSSCVVIPLPSTGWVMSGNLGGIYIDGLIPNMLYTVDWYDTYSENTIISSSNFMAFSDPSFAWNGFTTITPPIFGGNCNSHEYGFKIHPTGQAKSASANIPISNIEQVMNFNGVKVYPNPSSNKIFLSYDTEKYKEITIELYDLSGRLILKQNNISELNTATIENGAYLIKISNDKEVKTFKINILH